MAFEAPTQSEIRTAKRQAVGGGRKRCRKGKNCSAACIQAGMECLVEMPEAAGVATTKVAAMLQKRVGGKMPAPPQKTPAEVRNLINRSSGNTSGSSTQKSDAPDLAFESWNNQQLKNRIRYADAPEKLRVMQELKRRGEKGYSGGISELKSSGAAVGAEFPKVTGVRGYDPVKAYNAPGSKSLGSGAMGVVKETDGHPPGIVKMGSIGRHEAEALKVLNGTGVAPTLLGQKIIGIPRVVDEGLGSHVDEAKGYLGMSKSPGKPLAALKVTKMSPQEREEMADAFIATRATLHRNGVAHNDMHTNNYFYDQGTKKGHLVDFGLAQVDKRAALMEALGLGFSGKGGVGSSFEPSFGYEQKGDYQAEGIKSKLGTVVIPSKNFDRYMDNRTRVLKEMRQEHPAAIKNYRDGGIRLPKSDLDTSGLTEDQAKTYIDKLYEGIN